MPDEKPADGGFGKPAVVRTFESGANRDIDAGKLDYEGFLNPLVLRAFAQYMHHNRQLRDGSIRDSDNWQKGFPEGVALKSLLRHTMDLWLSHREGGHHEEDPAISLCAIIFNAQAMLLELLTKEPATIGMMERYAKTPKA